MDFAHIPNIKVTTFKKSQLEQSLLQDKFKIALFLVVDLMKINNNIILEKIKSCGKCHDFAALTIYCLSCHKFLSYSVMAHVRWMNWFLFAIACSVHVVVYQLRSAVDSERFDTVLQNISVFIDLVHMFITAIDILNIRDERLEDNNWSARGIFYFRGVCGELTKLLLLLLLMILWMTLTPPWMSNFGYYEYLLGCFVIGFFVHLIIMYFPALSDVEKVKTKNRKKMKKH